MKITYPCNFLFFFCKFSWILAETRLRYKVLFFELLEFLVVMLDFIKCLISFLKSLVDDIELGEELLEFVASLFMIQYEIFVILCTLGMSLLDR